MRRLAFAAALGLVMLGGCAAPGSAPADPLDWDDELDLGAPGERIDEYAAVEYYPACGNEVLTWEGERYFPFTPAHGEDFPAAHAAMPASVVECGALGFARASAMRAAPGRTVVAPGPGDDVGTLVVYDGGFAHWSADSGELATWLTTTELTYAWVC